MATIAFTTHLREVGPCISSSYAGATLAEMLESVSVDYPRLKGYVLDDQGRLRKHIAVFVDGELKSRDSVLNQLLDERSSVYVMQALSGG